MQMLSQFSSVLTLVWISNSNDCSFSASARFFSVHDFLYYFVPGLPRSSPFRMKNSSVSTTLILFLSITVNFHVSTSHNAIIIFTIILKIHI